MQKKHLHLQLTVLLLLLFGGCASDSKSPDNPYLSGNDRLIVELTGNKIPIAQWGDMTVGILYDAGQDELSTSCSWVDGLTVGLWEKRTGGVSQPGSGPLLGRRTTRSLTVSNDQEQSRLSVYALPYEEGFVAYWDETSAPEEIMITFDFRSWNDPGTESVGPRKQPKWVDAGKGVWVWPDEEYRNPCLGFSPPVDDLMALVDDTGALRLKLPEHQQTQIILARSKNHDDAIAMVRGYHGLDADETQEKLLRDNTDRFAFTINTEDEQTNQAVALLQTSLLGAKRNAPIVNPEDAADYADLAAGLWLNSKAVPLAAREQDLQTKDYNPLGLSEDEIILWSANTVRAVSQYGILQGSQLANFTSEVMATLARLDADYTEDESAILNPLPEDTLMRKALSYIRFANLMNLGEEISLQRGQSVPAGQYRKKALDATKQAQNAFEASARDFRNAQIVHDSQLNKAQKKDQADIDPLLLPDEINAFTCSYPDTAAFIDAGVRYGFYYLSRSPLDFILRAPRWTPFLWQRWVRHQFTTSSALTSTSDSDSLMSVLLTGPVPGILTDEGRPDLTASAQALQNIAEVYLGIQPNWADHAVTINPRLPKSWGRTAARIPLGTGFLVIDYNLVQETATVRIENIDYELNVLFYYPLPSEQTLRTQFKLAKERPEIKIFVTRDRGNRMRLEIE